MMTFEEFVSAVKKGIGIYFPTDFIGAEIDLVEKNNGIIKTGLIVHRQRVPISPTLYLNGFYQEYVGGVEFPELLETIARTCMENIPNELMLEDIDLSFFDSIKDQVICRLINQKENTGVLQQLPHKEFEDLAVVYRICITKRKNDIVTISVDNALMAQWGISLEELHALAVLNMERLFPPVLKPMTQVVIGTATEKEIGVNLLQDNDCFLPEHMYVLSNPMYLNGATALLYPNILERIRQVLGTDYYVLPSSIHETIILPKYFTYSENGLGDMVRDINASSVPLEEKLSDHIYEYSSEEKSLKQVRESLPE